jgi:hypothetical protein
MYSLLHADAASSYCYVDVAVAGVMNNCLKRDICRIVFSYDIACKYSINFLKRVMEYDVKLLDHNKFDLVFLVPKFHLGGHVQTCADKYAFDYTQNVGRMSGKLVETPWAAMNWLQYSTQEMGWGMQ